MSAFSFSRFVETINNNRLVIVLGKHVFIHRLCFNKSKLYLKTFFENRLVFLGDDARETNNTDLGEMNFVKIQTTVIEQTKKSGYIKWTGEDRFTIGKFAAENGTAAAVRYFKSKFPKIKESSVRGFKENYEKQLKQATQNKEQLTTKIIPKYELKTGRPLLLGKFDEMVQTYIHGLSSRGAVITWAVANAAAKALMKKYPGVIGEIDVDSSYWASQNEEKPRQRLVFLQ